MPTAQQVQSSTEFAALIESVKQALVTITKTELGLDAAQAPEDRLPKVVDRLIFDLNSGKWANALKSNRHVVVVAGQELKKIHCYMVGYGGIATYPNNTNRAMPFSVRFIVVAYYQDDVGTDEANAEAAQGEELAKLAYAYNNTPNLTLPGTVVRVTDYRERREPTKIGDVQAREAIIEFLVELQPVPKMYQ